MSHSDEQLQAVLETLEECRKVLNESDSRETAELLSIVILDLRMKLKGIANAELRRCQRSRIACQADAGPAPASAAPRGEITTPPNLAFASIARGPMSHL